ncbi:Hypothetical protein PBC10988_10310 [Planctomycetales bacterium 10988]|nr:Hypothetical protein PBC10988_10310 [Planctomycetales bacterium 10988]
MLTSVASLILCGGASRRLGGQKPWLPFAGSTLLGHTVQLLRAQTMLVAVVSQKNQSLPKLPEETIFIHDPLPEEGPLMGILAGIEYFQEEVDWVFVCGCDTPFLSPSFLKVLFEHCGTAPAVIPILGQPQPLLGLYNKDLIEPLREYLQSGSRAIHRFLKTIEVTYLPESAFGNATSLSAMNLNWPQDYQQALQKIHPDLPADWGMLLASRTFQRSRNGGE